ncbi:MAG: hypothetical protein ABI216_11455 [Devosia sp.]
MTVSLLEVTGVPISIACMHQQGFAHLIPKHSKNLAGAPGF